jgi:hypothetical protein
LADRLAQAAALTTDGHKVYREAIEGAFGPNIDYAMLIKMYEGDSGTDGTAERRYRRLSARVTRVDDHPSLDNLTRLAGPG